MEVATAFVMCQFSYLYMKNSYETREMRREAKGHKTAAAAGTVSPCELT